ncbi:MAG: amidohydrolase family protein [Beijerinckiaceae bacterium]
MNQPVTGIPQMLPAQVIDTSTDTRDILAHARRVARQRGLQDWFVVDIDAHHVETVHWGEVVKYIEDPVIRETAMMFHQDRHGAPPYGLNGDLGLRYQGVGGRIPHQEGVREKVDDTSVHRDVTLTRRAMDSLGVDVMVVFPTPMLFLGLHPQPEMEVWLSRAYNRWMVDNILSADDRIKFLAVLPFNTPHEAERVVAEMSKQKGVIGFCVPSTRHKPVHHNDYMRLYRMIEETGMPVTFHAGYHWDDPSLKTVNRFLGMHALGFAWPNIVHTTNWVLNGMPVRFPKLKVMWIESGLAWVPFLMQRLDDQFLMRPSEAPHLKRLPSEYMRDHCWYTTQPMETTNMKALECTLDMIKAETQLCYASDWPHFDFDLPSEITDLPFLDEQAKRNILGLNAAKLFNLDTTIRKQL